MTPQVDSPTAWQAELAELLAVIEGLLTYSRAYSMDQAPGEVEACDRALAALQRYTPVTSEEHGKQALDEVLDALERVMPFLHPWTLEEEPGEARTYEAAEVVLRRYRPHADLTHYKAAADDTSFAQISTPA